jgi:hypothetical protein
VNAIGSWQQGQEVRSHPTTRKSGWCVNAGERRRPRRWRPVRVSQFLRLSGLDQAMIALTLCRASP